MEIGRRGNAGEDITAGELDCSCLIAGGDGEDGGVGDVIEIECSAEAGEILRIRLDAGDTTGGDASGGQKSVEAGVRSDVEEMIARPKVVIHEVEQVVVEPLGAVLHMLGDDAVGVAGIDTVTKGRMKNRGLV